MFQVAYISSKGPIGLQVLFVVVVVVFFKPSPKVILCSCVCITQEVL